VRLDGRVAFVTGASRGIGRHIAFALARAGATVVGTGRSAESIEQIAGGEDRAVVPYVLDVGEQDACAAAIRWCEDRYGPVDVLVNNAGVAVSRPFLKTDQELWREVMRVDVEGALWLTQAAVPGMLERGSGRVVAIASVAATVGFPYLTAYAAAKHALLGLMRSLAAEYRTSGITFNCICPHYVDTPMTRATIQNIIERTGRSPEQALTPLLTPQGRLIDPEEVAALCLFLVSDQARSVTGQALGIDGGFHQG
jgi:NAD(P)-dependent dehydrogenase (short-subunit alcohol dehydrogenase family)